MKEMKKDSNEIATTTEREQQLKQAARRALEEKSASVDTALADRLLAARRQALANIPPENAYRKSVFYLTGAVTASLLAVLIYINLADVRQEDSSFLLSDFEILIEEGDELEMLENELDFYVWLESQVDES